jgi:hypothetical protein
MNGSASTRLYDDKSVESEGTVTQASKTVTLRKGKSYVARAKKKT